MLQTFCHASVQSETWGRMGCSPYCRSQPKPEHKQQDQREHYHMYLLEVDVEDMWHATRGYKREDNAAEGLSCHCAV